MRPLMFIALPLLASSAFGATVVDGSAEKSYGAPLAVQHADAIRRLESRRDWLGERFGD